MDDLVNFYNLNGIILTLIAIVGIIILGILKYAGVFKKLPEKKRHIVYMAISVAISIIGGVVYMVCTKTYTLDDCFRYISNIFALNQTFYNIFKATTIDKLFETLLNKLAKKSAKKETEEIEEIEEIKETEEIEK